MRHDGDSTNDRTQRLTVPQAATVMGISAEAVRQRIKRGTLPIEKDTSGSVFVLLDADSTSDSTRTNTDISSDSTALIEELKDRVRSLETQLSEERTANRENRRLLAAAFERIPAIEAPDESPPEPRDDRETATEEPDKGHAPLEKKERRSWLRRFFFGP